jgi:hypothetical protein
MRTHAEKSKEGKSRAVANSVAQEKSSVKQGFGFADNRPDSFFQRKINAFTAANKQTTQRATRYKIFERDESDKPMIGEGLTKLGVRRTELTIGKDDVVKGVVNGIPQGMSVSDAYEEEIKRGVSKDTESIFRIDESKFDNRIKVRDDPEGGNHFLAGPLTKLKYDGLNQKVQSSIDQWVLTGVQVNDEWKKTGYTMR